MRESRRRCIPPYTRRPGLFSLIPVYFPFRSWVWTVHSLQNRVDEATMRPASTFPIYCCRVTGIFTALCASPRSLSWHVWKAYRSCSPCKAPPQSLRPLRAATHMQSDSKLGPSFPVCIPGRADDSNCKNIGMWRSNRACLRASISSKKPGPMVGRMLVGQPKA